MSVADKLDVARKSFGGSNVAKAVCKATSREIMGPKKKHVDCKLILRNLHETYFMLDSSICCKLFRVRRSSRDHPRFMLLL